MKYHDARIHDTIFLLQQRALRLTNTVHSCCWRRDRAATRVDNAQYPPECGVVQNQQAATYAVAVYDGVPLTTRLGVTFHNEHLILLRVERSDSRVTVGSRQYHPIGCAISNQRVAQHRAGWAK